MATEKQLKLRIVSTTNISKITKSMKMVSAAKLRGDQQRLNASKPFAAWAGTVTGEEKQLEGVDTTDMPSKNLVIVLNTDKGLCGGVNTILNRMTRQMVASLTAQGKDYSMYIMGEKGRASFRRVYSDKMEVVATERRIPYSFSMASALAMEALHSDAEAIHIVYNRFKSAISYIPSVKSITPLTDPTDEFLHPYEVEPENDPETLANFFEYTLATQIFHSLMENATSEQSSRMTAMENASKNAGEMIQKLTLQYNRARQARITTELIEIISGASALKG